MRTYEAMLIFTNAVREDAIDKATDRIRSEIEKLNGKVLRTEFMGRRGFAHPMDKQHSGQYWRMIFNLLPTEMAALKARLKLVEDIFRQQITLLDEEAVELALAEPVAAAAEGSAPEAQ